ncbi:MAG: hypothetical protein KAQ64_05415 [Candidatus Pacebacteria bacterium]|nr:hypothetical protein [Candidatus Paceibacterota bacterium]
MNNHRVEEGDISDIGYGDLGHNQAILEQTNPEPEQEVHSEADLGFVQEACPETDQEIYLGINPGSDPLEYLGTVPESIMDF